MSALYQSDDKPLIQVRSDLWINPRAILFVEGFDDSVVINLNGTDKAISWADWGDIRPHVVTLPAPAAGSTPTPQSVTRQAVNEIMAEEGHTADMLSVMHKALEATEAPTPETDLSRLIQVVKSGDFVILDTETTGLYENAEICQISIIDSNGTPLVDTLVRPQKPIPADATRIHGITNDMVRPYPDWLNINEAVWNACKGKTVIVYNAEYDFRLITQSEKACKPFALSDWHMVKRECAMLAYGEYRGIWNEYHGNWKWHKLSDAASRIGYTLPDGMKAHSALADCLMTLAICRKLAGV